MQISIGTWSLAVGMEWSIPKDAQEIGQAKSAHKNGMHVVAKRPHMSWLGVHELPLTKAHTAALLVGLVEPNTVVIHPVSQTHSWVCSIRDGMPLVGRDLVLPNSEADKAAREWFSRTEGLTLVGENRNASLDLAAVLKKLDEAVSKKNVRKKLVDGAELKPNQFQIKKVVLGGAGIGVVSLAAFMVGQLQSNTPVDSKTAHDQATMQVQASAVKRVMEIAQAKKQNQELQAKQVAEIETKYKTRVSPIEFWNRASAVRAHLPVSMFGYIPQKQDCAPTECIVSWHGSGTLVNLSDKLRLPNAEPNYTANLEASSRFNIHTPTVGLPDLNAASPAAFQLMIRSVMALNYPGAQIGDVKELAVAPPAATGLQPIVAAYAGSFSIQLSGPTALAKATSLAALLQNLPIALTAINYDKQAQRVDFVGEYAMLAATH